MNFLNFRPIERFTSSYPFLNAYVHSCILAGLHQPAAVPSGISRDKMQKVIPSSEVRIGATYPKGARYNSPQNRNLSEKPDWFPPPSTNPSVSEFLRNMRIPYRNGLPSLQRSTSTLIMVIASQARREVIVHGGGQSVYVL